MSLSSLLIFAAALFVAAGSPGPNEVPYWGADRPDDHTYYYAITGTGLPLTFALHDSIYAGTAVDSSGDPLQVSSAAEMVMIDGVRQPLETHQTKLLERYRDLERNTLPEAYQR